MILMIKMGDMNEKITMIIIIDDIINLFMIVFIRFWFFAIFQLPVLLVIRLCTSEDAVVKYWNNIDSQLEIDVDVLDDQAGINKVDR